MEFLTAKEAYEQALKEESSKFNFTSHEENIVCYIRFFLKEEIRKGSYMFTVVDSESQITNNIISYLKELGYTIIDAKDIMGFDYPAYGIIYSGDISIENIDLNLLKDHQWGLHISGL